MDRRVRVRLYATEAAARLGAAGFDASSDASLRFDGLATIEDGVARFSGYEPGTYAMWIDPLSAYAPLVLPRVELSSGPTDLGALEFSPGSTLRIRLLVAEGSTPPRASAYVFHKETQVTRRVRNQAPQEPLDEIVVCGIGAGEYVVGIEVRMTNTSFNERIRFDGRSEVTVDLDVR
jgi:hypothetical protein